MDKENAFKLTSDVGWWGCTCMRVMYSTPEGYDASLIKDPWCPVHKEYLFEYESKNRD